MEFEKTLFRVHEKILTHQQTPKVLKTCILVNLGLCAFFLLTLIIADVGYRNKPGLMGTELHDFIDHCYVPGAHPSKDIIFRFVVCDYDHKAFQKRKQDSREHKQLDECGRPISQDGENGDKETDSTNENSKKEGGKRVRILEFNEGKLDQNSFSSTTNNIKEEQQKDRVLEKGEDQENLKKEDEKEQQQESDTLKSDGEAKQKEENEEEQDDFQLSNYCKGEAQLYMEMSSNMSFINFPKDYKKQYKLKYVQIFQNPSEYGSNFMSRAFIEYFINYENILLNDMITGFNYQDIYAKNMNTTEIWHFPQSVTNNQDGSIIRLITVFFEVLKIMFGLFLTSAITAIYIKITIICAPIFILVIISCLNRFGNNEINRTTLYRAFPWMGIYLYSLDMAQSKITYLVRSFLMLILLFYCVYLSSSIFISSYTFFYKSIPRGLDENFFGFQAFIEFGVLLFLRTRSGIKWFPKTALMMIITYLVYVQQTVYGFYYLGLCALSAGVFAFFGMILYAFEYPAVFWNPSYNFTPSCDRPRTLYFPLFSMSWFYDLPQLWTMFYPLHGRSFFSESQLSLVDRNYVLLNQTMTQSRANNNNMGQPLQQQQQQNNINNNNPAQPNSNNNSGGNNPAQPLVQNNNNNFDSQSMDTGVEMINLESNPNLESQSRQQQQSSQIQPVNQDSLQIGGNYSKMEDHEANNL